MAEIPKTSITLLKALAGDSTSSRWTEFCRAYEEPMRGFLRANYPSVEPEDVIQETLLVLVKKLPDYHYTPDEHGHFRCYLMGILKHKAVDFLRKRMREQKYIDETWQASEGEYRPSDDKSWQVAVLETAVAQMLADATIPARDRPPLRAPPPDHLPPPPAAARDRTISGEVALDLVPPAEVAARFGLTRHNVDQIKLRLTRRLSSIVTKLTADL